MRPPKRPARAEVLGFVLYKWTRESNTLEIQPAFMGAMED